LPHETSNVKHHL